MVQEKTRRDWGSALLLSMMALTTAVSGAEVPAYPHSATGAVSGERKTWHKITLGFDGPATGETATPNPFTDYSLDVTFTHGETETSYTVPGYYAADGKAASSSATTGNVWLVHFAPDRAGTWFWNASFKTGRNVAREGGGTSAGFMDAMSGHFEVVASDKGGDDLRGKGRLNKEPAKSHLRFSGTAKDLVCDCSELAQWGALLDDAQKKGVAAQVAFNEQKAGSRDRLRRESLDNERKLFYRELIARFGHLNGVEWVVYGNGSPGSTNATRDAAAFIHTMDPYRHPVAVIQSKAEPVADQSMLAASTESTHPTTPVRKLDSVGEWAKIWP